MARGFESKDVEFQQSEADRGVSPARTLSPEEREREARRRLVELSLSKSRSERASATNPRHCEMLDQAIRALEDQVRELLKSG